MAINVPSRYLPPVRSCIFSAILFEKFMINRIFFLQNTYEAMLLMLVLRAKRNSLLLMIGGEQRIIIVVSCLNCSHFIVFVCLHFVIFVLLFPPLYLLHQFWQCFCVCVFDWLSQTNQIPSAAAGSARGQLIPFSKNFLFSTF